MQHAPQWLTQKNTFLFCTRYLRVLYSSYNKWRLFVSTELVQRCFMQTHYVLAKVRESKFLNTIQAHFILYIQTS